MRISTFAIATAVALVCVVSGCSEAKEPSDSGQPDSRSTDRAPAKTVTASSVATGELGSPCSDSFACAQGECMILSALGVDFEEPRCVTGDPCSLVTCPEAAVCGVDESLPASLTCVVAGSPHDAEP